jgi:hypothetical protein
MSFADSWLLDSTSSTNALDSSGGDNKTPDFLTQQSLASFPIASAAVTAVWKLAKDAIFKDDKWASSAWVPLVLAALLIVAGLAYTWTDLSSTGKKIGACIIGGINAAMLTAAVLGIEVQVFS